MVAVTVAILCGVIGTIALSALLFMLWNIHCNLKVIAEVLTKVDSDEGRQPSTMGLPYLITTHPHNQETENIKKLIAAKVAEAAKSPDSGGNYI